MSIYRSLLYKWCTICDIWQYDSSQYRQIYSYNKIIHATDWAIISSEYL